MLLISTTTMIKTTKSTRYRTPELGQSKWYALRGQKIAGRGRRGRGWTDVIGKTMFKTVGKKVLPAAKKVGIKVAQKLDKSKIGRKVKELATNQQAKKFYKKMGQKVSQEVKKKIDEKLKEKPSDSKRTQIAKKALSNVLQENVYQNPNVQKILRGEGRRRRRRGRGGRKGGKYVYKKAKPVIVMS